MNQQGNIDKFEYERYNLRMNLEAKVYDNLKMIVGLSGIRGDRKGSSFSAGGGEGSGYGQGTEWMSIARQAVNAHPYLPIKYNGMYTASPNDISQPSNPLAALEGSGWNKNTAMVLQTNVSLEWDIPWVKGLAARVTGSYDYSSTTSKNLSTPYYMMLAIPPSFTSPEISYRPNVMDPRARTTISLLEGLNKTDRLTGQASLNYAVSIDKTHNIDAMLLSEARDMKNNSFSAQVEGLDFAELPELSLGTPNTTGNPIVGASRVARTASLVYRLRYDYLNKYLLEASGRYDGSHKFAGNIAGKRFGFFPSASLGWRLSEESFMKNIVWLDNLKLRGGMGLFGSSAGTSDNQFAFLSTYTYNAAPIILNGQETKAMYPSLVENLDLTWEKTRTANIGFDVSVLRGMLSWEFDYFYNYTYDMIGLQDGNKPPSMGGHFPSVINRNSIEAKGIDMSISYLHKFGLMGRPFTYGAKINVTWAKNRWLRYNDSENVPDYQKLTGKPVDAQYIYIAEGLFRTEEEIDNAAWRRNTRPRLGDIKYKDLNGDGVIDAQDAGWFGRSNRPELSGGFTLYADWNGFDLNAMFTGAAQLHVSMTGTYFNGSQDTSILTRAFKAGANSPVYLVEGAWRPDNPNGEYPRLSVNTPTNDNGYASTFWIRDGKYIRLKSMQFGYTLPKYLTQKASMEKVRLYVEGSNLFTWSGLPPGLDPEMPRVVNAYYPQQQTYAVGVTVTF
jgi:TonB-linked SusC/RagA family outer membrane protein